MTYTIEGVTRSHHGYLVIPPAMTGDELKDWKERNRFVFLISKYSVTKGKYITSRVHPVGFRSKLEAIKAKKDPALVIPSGELWEIVERSALKYMD